MKKKILAGILSFTMLAGQVLPVVAADDVDTAVSENETVVEESAEEAAEETAASEDDVVDETVEDVSAEIDNTVFNDFGEADPAEFDKLGTLIESKVVFEENGEKTVEDSYLVSVADLINSGASFTSEDFAVNDTELLQAVSSAPYIYVAEAKEYTIPAGEYNAKVQYYSHINYRGKKVKPADIAATVTNSDLYSLAASLTSSQITYDLIKWKMTAKKNTNAGTEAYFTVKASVDSKVAKQLGITKKNLSTLKKAVKSFNKGAKKEKIPFTIDPVSFDYIMSDPDTYAYMQVNLIKYYRNYVLQSVEIKGITIRCLLNPDQASKSKKKWTKPSKKDVTIKKQANKTYTITANNLNYGSYGYYTVGLIKEYGQYYYTLDFTQTRR